MARPLRGGGGRYVPGHQEKRTIHEALKKNVATQLKGSLKRFLFAASLCIQGYLYKSEIGLDVWSKNLNFTCSRNLFTSVAIFFFLNTVFLHTCASFSELPWVNSH